MDVCCPKGLEYVHALDGDWDGEGYVCGLEVLLVLSG